MSGQTYPPNEVSEVPLEVARVRELVRAALLEAIEVLREFPVNTAVRQISRPTADGFRTYDLPAPNYWPELLERISHLVQQPAGKAFTDYLWSCGACRTTFSRDDGEPVPRSAWERHAWSQILHSPLQWILITAAVEELSVTGGYTPWHVHPESLESAVVEIANQTALKQRSIRAECLLGLDDVEIHEPFELDDGIVLERLGTQAQCVYLSKFANEHLWDDIRGAVFRVRLSATVTLADLSDETAVASVLNTIDRAKWALLYASQTVYLIEEGPIIMRTPSGHRIRTIHRSALPKRLGAGRLSREQIQVGADALATFRAAVGTVPSLAKAMWLFGRSCVASLARDSLLDATIALEYLLVPGGGESRYRLALHGSGLLRDREPEKCFKDLQEIYGLRSGAAHSGGRDDDKFSEKAPLARLYLANIIHAVSRLVLEGSIVVSSQESVAHGVERWIRQRVYA